MNKGDFLATVRPYSMTSNERIECLYESLEYIRTNDIKGDLVECGVWRGGNILGIMEYLNYHKMFDRHVWLYDTFEGMTEPEDSDIDCDGKKAIDIMGLPHVKAYAELNDVKNNLSKSTFPIDNLHYIVGDIVETLNYDQNIPKEISLLRLDTDWYKSTKKELNILYPKLENNGVLIVDDYGHWQGSKKAFDEYFENVNHVIEKIDYTGIKIIKNENI